MAGRTTRSDSSMAIDALKDSDQLKIPRGTKYSEMRHDAIIRVYLWMCVDVCRNLWRLAVFCFVGAVSWHIAARPEIEDAPTDGTCAPGLSQTI